MCIYAWKYGHEIKIIDETTTFFMTCLNYEWKRVRGGGNRKSEEFQEAFLFLDLPIVPSVLSFFLSPDPWSSNGNNKVASSNYWNDQFQMIKKKKRDPSTIYFTFRESLLAGDSWIWTSKLVVFKSLIFTWKRNIWRTERNLMKS